MGRPAILQPIQPPAGTLLDSSGAFVCTAAVHQQPQYKGDNQGQMKHIAKELRNVEKGVWDSRVLH